MQLLFLGRAGAQTPPWIFSWSVALIPVAHDSVAAAVGVREESGYSGLHCICTRQCRTLRCSQQTERRPGLPGSSRGVFFHRFFALFLFAVPNVCVCVCVCVFMCVCLCVFFRVSIFSQSTLPPHLCQWPDDFVSVTSAVPSLLVFVFTDVVRLAFGPPGFPYKVRVSPLLCQCPASLSANNFARPMRTQEASTRSAYSCSRCICVRTGHLLVLVPNTSVCACCEAGAGTAVRVVPDSALPLVGVLPVHFHV